MIHRTAVLMVFGWMLFSTQVAGAAENDAAADSLRRAEREEALAPLREEHRSAKSALAMTAAFPGWGQLYADTPFWGVVAFGVEMFYLGNILMESRRVERERVRRDALPLGSPERDLRDELVNEHKERARDYVWWASGGMLVVALDAFVSVELADFDSGDPPTPDLDRDWLEPGSAGEGVALRLNFSF
jgi:hypothetical protein